MNQETSETQVPPTLTEDAFLDGKLRILQPEKGYRAGIDAVFLGATVSSQPGEKLFELGIGTGVASLCALTRNPLLWVTGVEVAGRYAMLCSENAERNGFADRVRVIHADVKEVLRRDLATMPEHETFDHAIANPPFYDEDKTTASPNLLKARANAFKAGDLEVWIKAMHAMLQLRGTMAIVHRVDALGSLLHSMTGRFGDIRIAPLYVREGTVASRVIVQGIKGSKAPMQLLRGLVLHDETSNFTPEANAVLREGAAWPLR